MAEATLCKTKAGKGFKIVIDEVWYYTSKSELFRLLNDSARACTFRTIVDEEEENGRPEEQAASVFDTYSKDDDFDDFDYEETGTIRDWHMWQEYMLDAEDRGAQ